MERILFISTVKSVGSHNCLGLNKFDQGEENDDEEEEGKNMINWQQILEEIDVNK